MMIICFIGSPGAGKGTQGARLAVRLQIPHLSTGEMLRQAKSDKTPLGRRVAPLLDSGGLVDDVLVSEIIAERTAAPDCSNGFLLDGYPRTVPQAKSFDELLARREVKLDYVIELHVSEEVSIARLSGRFERAKSPRPEDRPDAIPQRIGLYRTATRPLFEYYQKQGVLRKIDGESSPATVFQRILDSIGIGHQPS